MRYLLLFLALAPLTLQAQDVQAGLKLGLNVASLYNTEDINERGAKPGLNVGAFVDVGLSDELGLLTGLEYSQKGEREKNTVGGVDIVESLHLNYLDIPILFRYRATSVGLYTGPQFGFLLSARFKQRFDGDEETDVDVKDSFESTDVSWVFGIYVPVVDRLWIDARAQLGLTNILDEEQFPGNPEASNQVFQVSLMIPLTN